VFHGFLAPDRGPKLFTSTILFWDFFFFAIFGTAAKIYYKKPNKITQLSREAG
jgi:hypothetical protein